LPCALLFAGVTSERLELKVQLLAEPVQVLCGRLLVHQDLGVSRQSSVPLLRASPWALRLRRSSATIRGADVRHRAPDASLSCWPSAGRMKLYATSSRQFLPAVAGGFCDEFKKGMLSSIVGIRVVAAARLCFDRACSRELSGLLAAVAHRALRGGVAFEFWTSLFGAC